MTFSTSPNLCHRTTLLRTDVPYCYITLVSVGISKLGCTDMHFIEPGVKKVNGAYHRDNLLAQKLLPDMCRLAQDEFFLCSNRTAPRHIEHTTLSLSCRDARLHSSNTVATKFAGP